MPNAPKPTQLKIMNGSARQHPERINHAEPSPAVGGEAPAWLPTTGVARQTWDRLYPIVSGMRVMTVADAEALALACVTLRDYLATPQAHWRKRLDLSKAYLGLLKEFGMTPSSRTKVSTVGPTKSDPVADWQSAK